MKFYANNIEVKVKEGPIVKNNVRYQEVYDEWNVDCLQNNLPVLFYDSSNEQIIDAFKFIIDENIQVLKRITFEVQNKSEFKDFLKNTFRVVKAAGGVVQRKDKVLVMKRHGLWDIPKGKIEKGEGIEEAAIREVEEECGVEVTLRDKITKTKHIYKYKGEYAIKLTHWFRMNLLSEKGLTPQLEEGITEVKWMTQEQASKLNTYASITGLLEKYYSS